MSSNSIILSASVMWSKTDKAASLPSSTPSTLKSDRLIAVRFYHVVEPQWGYVSQFCRFCWEYSDHTLPVKPQWQEAGWCVSGGFIWTVAWWCNMNGFQPGSLLQLIWKLRALERFSAFGTKFTSMSVSGGGGVLQEPWGLEHWEHCGSGGCLWYLCSH